MSQLLVLVHTVPPLVDEFTQLCRSMLPDVALLHVLDEPLLERIRRHGAANPEDDERLAAHVRLAEELGASAVLVTCSTVSLSVDRVRAGFHVPITKIDEAMAEQAVRVGPRISIIATSATTLEPSRLLVEDRARLMDRPVQIRLRLVADAAEALWRGDGGTHDGLVERAVREEAEEADVVVLAQASMARVLRALAPSPVPAPVLASPQSALAEIRLALAEGARRASEGAPSSAGQ
jgi:Asp/Glu/hydantoin racemase